MGSSAVHSLCRKAQFFRLCFNCRDHLGIECYRVYFREAAHSALKPALFGACREYRLYAELALFKQLLLLLLVPLAR